MPDDRRSLHGVAGLRRRRVQERMKEKVVSIFTPSNRMQTADSHNLLYSVNANISTHTTLSDSVCSPTVIILRNQYGR